MNKIIWLYKAMVSPFLGTRCRFYPSCSSYAQKAVESSGIVKGSWLALVRFMKCNPFHPGGYDPFHPIDAQRNYHG